MGGPAENTKEPWELHPDEYEVDLNQRGGAGLNVDLKGPQPMLSDNVRTAYDIKSLHRRLDEYTDDQLKSIPILPEGSPLEQGATYINLRDVEPKEFTARAGMIAACYRAYLDRLSSWISISASLPLTMSAVTRPDPHAMVQPSVPWPVLR